MISNFETIFNRAHYGHTALPETSLIAQKGADSRDYFLEHFSSDSKLVKIGVDKTNRWSSLQSSIYDPITMLAQAQTTAKCKKECLPLTYSTTLCASKTSSLISQKWSCSTVSVFAAFVWLRAAGYLICTTFPFVSDFPFFLNWHCFWSWSTFLWMEMFWAVVTHLPLSATVTCYQPSLPTLRKVALWVITVSSPQEQWQFDIVANLCNCNVMWRTLALYAP